MILLLLMLMVPRTALAEDKKPELNCEGYTMYTHPDKACREKLAEEYKEMVKQYLEAKAKKINATELRGALKARPVERSGTNLNE